MPVIKQRMPWTSQPQCPVGIDPYWLRKSPAYLFGAVGYGTRVHADNGYGLPDSYANSLISSHSLHGYAINGTTENYRRISDIGRAWYFDGVTEYPVGNSALNSVVTGSAPFSIVARVKFLSSAATTGIVGHWNPGLTPVWLYGWGLYQDGSTLRGVCAWNNSKNISASIPALNEWVTIGLRMGVSNGGLFINGVKVASGDLTNSNASVYDFHIGSKKQNTTINPSGTTYPWNGWIETVVGFKSALSDSDFLAIANNPWKIFAP